MSTTAAFMALIVLALLIRYRGEFRFTSMQSAWRWALLAGLVLLACTLFKVASAGSVMVQSALQYAAAVICLAPFIDVLGARRPAHQAWPWFVVCPMIVVLQWPAISQITGGPGAEPIEVQTPTFIGFLFVVLMGCGNYFGTRNTGAACLAAVGIVLLALPTSEWVDFRNSWLLPAALLLLTIAISCAECPKSNAPSKSTASVRHLDLWNDFSSLYGMVWAKRVMDRVNQFAERESWDVRMSVFGFVTHSNGAHSATQPCIAKDVDERPLVILCWVLRRFLDAEFLIRYVPANVIHKESKPDNSR